MPDMVSAQFWGKNTAFCVYLVHVKYWCTANSNLAYFELTNALECHAFTSGISNLGGRESLEIAVIRLIYLQISSNLIATPH